MCDAERVDPWLLGLVVLVVVGLGAIVFGALYDRSRNRRRAAEMLAPPSRVIPRMAADAPAPHYLSDLQARRRPRPPSPRSGAERAGFDAQLAAASTTLATGYLSKDFVTDPDSGRAVLDSPRILVCTDEIASIRELLPILEILIKTRTPLVIIAAAIEPGVRATLEVNAIRGTMTLLVVVLGDQADRQRVADQSGATPVDRADRQSGFVPPERLGHLDRWVSTPRESFLITSTADQVG